MHRERRAVVACRYAVISPIVVPIAASVKVSIQPQLTYVCFHIPCVGLVVKAQTDVARRRSVRQDRQDMM